MSTTEELTDAIDFAKEMIRIFASNKNAARHYFKFDEIAEIIRRDAERNDPKPLTLEELRERDGKPVFIHYPKAPEHGRWAIVEGVAVNGAIMFKHDYSLYDYGTQWIAYDAEPKEAQK